MTGPTPDARIRAYQAADRNACLALFDGNTPRFFTPEERADFARFLERDAAGWSFQVIEQHDRIVACGGYAVGEDGTTAHLCWGMVDRDRHRRGLGRMLTQARLRAAAAHPGLTQVHLDTSQHSHPFYASLGFETCRVQPDGYGPGLDRYDMTLTLADGLPGEISAHGPRFEDAT